MRVSMVARVIVDAKILELAIMIIVYLKINCRILDPGARNKEVFSGARSRDRTLSDRDRTPQAAIAREKLPAKFWREV
jgi:hypothetical protein